MPPQTSLADDGSSTVVSNSAATVDLGPLTPREIEVLKWIAVGKRNSEIGTILACSPRTVQKHVQNILHKLGMETRTAASTWWHERHHAAERNLAGFYAFRPIYSLRARGP
jgi:DNA-binding CsgD family transcriptional regulator